MSKSASSNTQILTRDLAVGRGDLFRFRHDVIEPEEGFNPRKLFTGLDELAEDIALNGIMQPLRGRRVGNRIILSAGERRWRATGIAIEKGLVPKDFPIPVVLEPKTTSELDRAFVPLSENTGQPLTLLEKGHQYAYIIATYGIKPAEVARRSQATKQAVSNALTLVNQGSVKLIDAVKDDRITGTTALGIIRLHPDHDAQDAALEAALANAASAGKSHVTPQHLQQPADNNQEQEEDEAASSERVVIPPVNDDGEEEEEKEEEEEEEQHDPSGQSEPDSGDDHSGNESAPSDPTPPDPSAMKRILDAPSTHRDGSDANTGPGSGYEKAEGRLKKIEELLDELNKDNCHTGRWDTLELVLDYLSGSHTIKTIKDHLLTAEEGGAS